MFTLKFHLQIKHKPMLINKEKKHLSNYQKGLRIFLRKRKAINLLKLLKSILMSKKAKMIKMFKNRENKREKRERATKSHMNKMKTNNNPKHKEEETEDK